MKRICIAVLAAILVSVLSMTTPARESDVPVLSDTDITIPWEEFKKFIDELTVTPPPPEPPPPVTVTVKDAAYDMRLVPGLLTVTADITAVTYGDEWHEVFVCGEGVSPTDLVVNGKDAPTLVKSDGIYALVRGEGTWTVRATLYVSAPDDPGMHSIFFNVPVSASASGLLSFDTGLTNVTVGGVTLSESEGKVETALGSFNRVDISYTVAAPRPEEAVGDGGEDEITVEPTLLAQTYMLLDVADEALYLTASVVFEVRDAPETSFTVELPGEFDLVDVVGEGIRAWSEDEGEGDGAPMLSVTTAFEIEGTFALTILMERAYVDGEEIVSVPAVRPRGTKRNTGFVSIVSDAGFEISEHEAQNLRPQDPSELPDILLVLSDLPPILGYRHTDDEWELAVSVTRGEFLPVIVGFIDSANTVGIVTDDGKLVMRTHYYVRNRGLQYLRMTLPEGGDFWSAAVSGRPTNVSKDPDGTVLIPLPLERTAFDEPIVVETVIFVPVHEIGVVGKVTLPMPVLNVPVAEMMATLYLPENRKYVRFGGDMEPIKHFEKIVAPDTSSEFVQENLKLRKEVYERQSELEEYVNKKQVLTGDELSALPEETAMFELPLRGDSYRFVKLIVLSEESRVTATYLKTGIYRLCVLFVILLLFFGVLKGVQMAFRSVRAAVKRET
ncbi:MAG: hypothetical protein JW885_03155 [Deltaproteobacteria bacterium]|nr:hypothetical protein [Candidatus Zymogenaceae bacterium]